MKNCTCGRSPTGKCLGWHDLTASEYQAAKVIWIAQRGAETLTEDHLGLWEALETDDTKKRIQVWYDENKRSSNRSPETDRT